MNTQTVAVTVLSAKRVPSLLRSYFDCAMKATQKGDIVSPLFTPESLLSKAFARRWALPFGLPNALRVQLGVFFRFAFFRIRQNVYFPVHPHPVLLIYTVLVL